MVMTAQIESFTATLDEARVFLCLHWKELGIHQEKMPLDPNYALYFERERNGETLLATLRSDGALVGYWMNFVAPGLHYKSTLTMTMDILWIHPDHRRANGGKILANCVKAEGKRRGVKLWVAGSKNHQPISVFLKFLGMEKTEEYLSMWIGD